MPAPLDQAIYTSLLELNVVDKTLIDEAFSESQNKQVSFQNYLIDKDLISDKNLGRVVAELYNRPFIRLADQTIPDSILKLIPEPMAKFQHIIAYKYDETGLYLGMDNPDNMQSIAFLGKKYSAPIKVFYATPHDIDQSTHAYSQDIKDTFTQLIQSYVDQAQTDNQEPPIIELINTLFIHADQNGVSDIHIESQRQDTLIRFRMDGILHDIARLPGELHERLVSRIKVLGKLRTDQHQAALDGKIVVDLQQLRQKTNVKYQTTLAKKQLDIRVSIVPVTDGEKIVLRLLSESNRTYSLSNVGFSEEDIKKVNNARLSSHGMILVTGPTGSGKTTTLYSILKTLNDREVNVMTIEDPVEYNLIGVNQIQVNTQTELTFAKGLRAIVRQDPDIILVGEIRDHDTADIAVNSAMTGHLVLSSLHTNNAATTIPRLIEMGIEPFLISSTTSLIVAQRLVRHICSQCRVSFHQSSTQLSTQIPKAFIDKVFGPQTELTMYQGKGCNVCHHTGYRGRIGVFEVMVIDDKLRQAIVSKTTASEIHKIAVTQGMTTMLEDGLNKVKQGLTTIEEIIRVTRA